MVGSLALKAQLYIARRNGEAHDLLKMRSTMLYTTRSTARWNRHQDQHEVEHVVAETRQRCGESTQVAASNGALSPRTWRCSTSIRSIVICYLHLNHVISYNSIKDIQNRRIIVVCLPYSSYLPWNTSMLGANFDFPFMCTVVYVD
jgi:hypothetical protein